MNNQMELQLQGVEVGQADLLTDLLSRAEQVLVKKLSNNDRDWARYENKHQAGVYIPVEQRDGGFFPALNRKVRKDPNAAVIREAWFSTVWPQAEERNREKRSRLVNYTSKGVETHITYLPKECFKDLSPASFLVIGRTVTLGETIYECITVDSATDDAEALFAQLDIAPDFLIGAFKPDEVRAAEADRVLIFIEEVIAAWKSGGIAQFGCVNAAMPSTEKLARIARNKFLKAKGLESVNPFVLDRPGDALREISRVIEWTLFKEFQRRERAVELVRIILGERPRDVSASDIIRILVEELPRIDALMLSASQQRKARAGYSYEHHIEAMLTAGAIPFEKQVIIEARKRPDFILPSLRFTNSNSDDANSGLILSAKTTLRERWKQVEREKGSRRLYLTTVDESIAGNAIQDMASIGVHLVVPEELMAAKETEYSGHKNVLTFRCFCDDVVAPSLAIWREQ